MIRTLLFIAVLVLYLLTRVRIAYLEKSRRKNYKTLKFRFTFALIILEVLILILPSFSSKYDTESQMAWQLLEEKYGTDLSLFLGDISPFREKHLSELFEKGTSYLQENQYQEAINCFRQIVTIDTSHTRRVAIFNLMGNVFYNTGKLDQSLGSYREAQDCARKAEDSSLIAGTLGNIATIYHHKGNWVMAESLWTIELNFYKTFGDKRGEARALSNLGILLLAKQPDYKIPLSYHWMALSIYESLYDSVMMIIPLNNIATVHHKRGVHLDSAELYYKQALALEIRFGQTRQRATTLSNLCTLVKRRGDYPLALKHCDEAKRLFIELNNEEGVATILHTTSQIESRQGNYKLAISLQREALSINERLEHPEGIASSYKNLGYIYFNSGVLDSAEYYFSLAYSIYDELGATVDAVVTKFKLMEIAEAKHKAIN